MSKEKRPRFIIYQANEKEYHICLEAKGKFLRWRSNYVPSMDIRFPREVNKITDVPVDKISAEKIFDQGTYTTNNKDTRTTAEEKVIAGVKQKTFTIILNGEKLKGRFAFKKGLLATVVQKYKDKYAVEEDVVAGDLLRSINIMVPNYDESQVGLENPRKRKNNKRRQPEIEIVDEVEEEITASKTIGNTEYHFTFYQSEHESDICVVSNDAGEAIVFQLKDRQWLLLKSIKHTVLRRHKEFIEHIKALLSQ